MMSEMLIKDWHHMDFYRAPGGLRVMCPLNPLAEAGWYLEYNESDTQWYVRANESGNDVEEVGTLSDCIDWVEEYYRQTFIEEFPRKSMQYHPMFNHDILYTHGYTVLLHKEDRHIWSFTVEDRDGYELFTRPRLTGYDAAVESFAGWLWDTMSLSVGRSDTEHYIDWLMLQVIQRWHEVVTNYFVLESLDQTEDYQAYQEVGDGYRGWKYLFYSPHYSKVLPQLYENCETIAHLMARDIFARGVEKEYGFKTFSTWHREQVYG